MTAATQSSYAIGRSVPLPYEQATLKKKLDVDFKKYVILGACNPPLAYQGFQAEADIGLLLPCNVVVYEEDPTRSRVAVLDPLVQLGITGRKDIEPLANEAKRRLERALSALPGA